MTIRKEIGSEFWSIPVCMKKHNLFSTDTAWFLSGRSALRQIILTLKEKRNVETVALPSWCCDSMIVPFIDAGVKVEFYPVFGEKQDLTQVQTDAILLMDYFGYTGQSNLEDYKGIVIRDVTHSLFSKVYNDADYYFGSLRKWAGFITGGFATGVESKTCSNEMYENIRVEAMRAKAAYMLGASESKEYLRLYNEAEEMLDSMQSVYGAIEREVQDAQILDVDLIKKRHRANAQRLLEEFEDIAIFKEIKESDCPMFVPILVPDGKRDALRKFLITNEIYCPVHWPVSEFHQLDSETEKIYKNELSLVCDQRYTVHDMERMIAVIKKFWKE